MEKLEELHVCRDGKSRICPSGECNLDYLYDDEPRIGKLGPGYLFMRQNEPDQLPEDFLVDDEIAAELLGIYIGCLVHHSPDWTQELVTYLARASIASVKQGNQRNLSDFTKKGGFMVNGSVLHVRKSPVHAEHLLRILRDHYKDSSSCLEFSLTHHDSLSNMKKMLVEAAKSNSFVDPSVARFYSHLEDFGMVHCKNLDKLAENTKVIELTNKRNEFRLITFRKGKSFRSTISEKEVVEIQKECFREMRRWQNNMGGIMKSSTKIPINFDAEFRTNRPGKTGKSPFKNVSKVMIGSAGTSLVIYHLPTYLVRDRNSENDGYAKTYENLYHPKLLEGLMLQYTGILVLLGYGISGDLDSLDFLIHGADVPEEITAARKLHSLDLGVVTNELRLYSGARGAGMSTNLIMLSGYSSVKGACSRIDELSEVVNPYRPENMGYSYYKSTSSMSGKEKVNAVSDNLKIRQDLAKYCFIYLLADSTTGLYDFWSAVIVRTLIEVGGELLISGEDILNLIITLYSNLPLSATRANRISSIIQYPEQMIMSDLTPEAEDSPYLKETVTAVRTRRQNFLGSGHCSFATHTLLGMLEKVKNPDLVLENHMFIRAKDRQLHQREGAIDKLLSETEDHSEEGSRTVRLLDSEPESEPNTVKETTPPRESLMDVSSDELSCEQEGRANSSLSVLEPPTYKQLPDLDLLDQLFIVWLSDAQTADKKFTMGKKQLQVFAHVPDLKIATQADVMVFREALVERLLEATRALEKYRDSLSKIGLEQLCDPILSASSTRTIEENPMIPPLMTLHKWTEEMRAEIPKADYDAITGYFFSKSRLQLAVTCREEKEIGLMAYLGLAYPQWPLRRVYLPEQQKLTRHRLQRLWSGENETAIFLAQRKLSYLMCGIKWCIKNEKIEKPKGIKMLQRMEKTRDKKTGIPRDLVTTENYWIRIRSHLEKAGWSETSDDPKWDLGMTQKSFEEKRYHKGKFVQFKPKKGSQRNEAFKKRRNVVRRANKKERIKLMKEFYKKHQ